MRFKLLSPHYLPGDKLILAGEEIGDGTANPVDFKTYPPTHEMEGLDEPSRAAVAMALSKFHQSNPIESMPMTIGNEGDK